MPATGFAQRSLISLAGCQRAAYSPSIASALREPACLDNELTSKQEEFSVVLVAYPNPPCTRVGIQYRSQENVRKDMREQAQRNLADEKEKENIERTKIPIGGVVFVLLKGNAIERVTSKYFRVVITDMDDKNIFSSDVGYHSPDATYIGGGLTLWKNVFYVSIDKKIGNEFKIYVIDKIDGSRWVYEYKQFEKKVKIGDELYNYRRGDEYKRL